MAAFSFADSYKAASLAPGPDIIRLRQESFENLRKDIDTKHAVELTRLYFGLNAKEPPAWFIGAFSETDPSFSMLDNEREAAVLAECLLLAGLKDGVVAVGLAVLSASANQNRHPLIERSKLVSDTRAASQKLSSNGRQHGVVDLDKIKLPAKSKVDDSADAFLQAPDWNKAAALFKQISNEDLGATKNLTNAARQESSSPQKR